MKYMFFLFWLAGACVAAGELQDGLGLQLDAGKLTFSPVEAALIAEGVGDQMELEAAVARYEALVASLALEPKQAKGKGKKQAKTLQKNIKSAFKLEGEPGDGLRALLEDKAQTSLSAMFLLADLAERAGLQKEDWLGLDGLEPTLVAAQAPRLEILAALLNQVAFHTEVTEAAEAGLALRLSAHLAPESTYAPNDLDKHYYNKALGYFNENQLEASAGIIIGVCARYPKQEIYSPLAYNTAIKLVSGNEGGGRESMALARALAPLMGPHLADFEKVLEGRQYNLAARLYNEKKYEQALVELERVKNPPSPENFQKVLTSTYAILVETRLLAGDRAGGDALMARLEKLDAARAETTRQRLAQLRLKDMVDSGDLEKALADAALRLDSEIDRNNYASILIQLNQGLRANREFDKAFTVLDNAAKGAELGETLNNLRLNTYSDWLETYEVTDYQGMLPIYQRLFADKQLSLSPENLEIMAENYGNAMHMEIVQLVADRKFKLADQRSKTALKIAPKHAALLEQRKLVDTILARTEP